MEEGWDGRRRKQGGGLRGTRVYQCKRMRSTGPSSFRSASTSALTVPLYSGTLQCAPGHGPKLFGQLQWVGSGVV